MRNEVLSLVPSIGDQEIRVASPLLDKGLKRWFLSSCVGVETIQRWKPGTTRSSYALPLAAVLEHAARAIRIYLM